MGDDAIGLSVAEQLEDFLVEAGFEVVLGETDFEYCLRTIKKGDFIIILDAAYSGAEPGTVRYMSIEEALMRCRRCNSQHESNLLLWLNVYGLEVKGAVLAIEIYKIEPNWGLSHAMQEILPTVCERVKDKIISILGEGYHA